MYGTCAKYELPFCDVYRSKASRPFADVLEKITMDSLQVVHIEQTRQGLFYKL
jgi:hypothetical protein